MRVSSGWSVSVVIALVDTVAFLSAAEAKSFLDTSSSLRRGYLEREMVSISIALGL